jgi:CBS domain-containing protein
MYVKELMSRKVVTVSRNDDLRMVDDLMAERHIRHIPVLEDHALVGMVSQRDLFKAGMSSTMGYGQKGQRAFLHTVRAKEIMTHPVITISSDTPVSEAADLMITKGIGCLPVIEANTLVGIVTKTDLLGHLRALSTSTEGATTRPE